VAGVGISENEVGVNGQASVKDLQTLFELIYLRFTAPRADPDAFAAVQNRMRSGLANRDANPAVVFNDAFTRIMTQGHPRSRPLTIDSLGQMSLERSLATYRELFANARGATFVFVGAFELEAIKPLVELYLGGLPTAANPQTWRDHGIRPPDGVVAETVRKGVEPRAQTRIAFHGPIDMHDLRNPTTFSAMGAVLQNQLREALREDLGGTYGVGVRTAMGWIPVEQYTLIVEFTSDPARADALAERIFAEIAALKAGPPADKVADVRTAMSRGFETNQRQNGWWLTGLSATYQFEPEIGPDNLLAFGRVVEGMTPETIRDAARQYIDTERYVRVTLLPETAPASN
jgi:zinc protease